MKHNRLPRAAHEYINGWGVFVLPFDCGHALALRVFPQNSFAPYRAVWHRDPAGWRISPTRVMYPAKLGT